MAQEVNKVISFMKMEPDQNIETVICEIEQSNIIEKCRVLAEKKGKKYNDDYISRTKYHYEFMSEDGGNKIQIDYYSLEVCPCGKKESIDVFFNHGLVLSSNNYMDKVPSNKKITYDGTDHVRTLIIVEQNSSSSNKCNYAVSTYSRGVWEKIISILEAGNIRHHTK